MTDKTSPSPTTCNGQQLRNLAQAGLHWLQSNHQHVNELNVFPVPDGDTGTNMLMTMQNAFKEVATDTATNAGKIAGRIAHGAMMGSRGNSGTILSQLWMGFARIVGDAEQFDAPLMAQAMREATETAYRGVQRPVEGTILTVAREITEAIEAAVANELHDLRSLLELMVSSGWQSVERTPELLPTLKKAGVVDSGGAGLVYVLEGMLRHLRGEEVLIEVDAAFNTDFDHMHESLQIEHPGENIYDVQFVMKAEKLDYKAIKAVMERMGDSVVVVGTDHAVKVHVHVRNPGIPLEYAVNVAPISDVVVENMLEQYEQYLQERQAKQAAEEAPLEFDPIDPGQIAVIAVASGHGMAKVFRDLGVAGLVNGGQTNNPSTEEMLNAIHALKTDKVILLPNNKNIILTAQQVAVLATNYQIKVIPTRTFPQGVAAMFNAYKVDGDLEKVAEAMTASKDDVVTLEITHATRTVDLEGVSVREGQIIGLVDGQLKIAGDAIDAVAQECLTLVEAIEDKELITLYYGDEVAQADAEALRDVLADIYPDMEFDVVMGGQKHYPYIISVE